LKSAKTLLAVVLVGVLVASVATRIVAQEAAGWRNAPLSSAAQFEPGLMAYHFSHSLYYANAEQFSEQVSELVNSADPKLEWFCVDAVAIDDVDYSAAAKLRSTFGVLKEKGVRMVFVLVSSEVKAELDRFGITDLVGKDAFYATGDDLLNAYRGKQ
jgi:MFS superfamily sulfate permease-like transporter